MKFCIKRTSWCSHFSKDCPCERAIKESTNIGVFWTIEINSADELMELIKSVGRVIIADGCREYLFNGGSFVYPYPLIEIYDDYRE